MLGSPWLSNLFCSLHCTFTGEKERRSLARSWPRDTAYHLLQLFCKCAHRLERTLDPCGVHRTTEGVDNHPPTCSVNAANLIDWSPAWMLWRVLHALGYRHFERGYSQSRICTEFSAQLESVGLWEWAIFVSLHEADQLSRDALVKAILARHVALVIPPGLLASLQQQQQHLNSVNGPQTLSTLPPEGSNAILDQLVLVPPPPLTRAEQFVVEKLGVPLCWIHEAKVNGDSDLRLLPCHSIRVLWCSIFSLSPWFFQVFWTCLLCVIKLRSAAMTASKDDPRIWGGLGSHEVFIGLTR